ncbi:MAG TPA: hypothetical protein PLQ05_02865 [Acidobacteriota bacterium]|nr:hypothetical protein [Acidobacteriota bacterium]HQO21131.1 hypothetical protein [Acidobacteriota bacterium]
MKRNILFPVLCFCCFFWITSISGQEDRWYEVRLSVSLPDYSRCNVSSPIKYYSDDIVPMPLTAVNVFDGSLSNVSWFAYESLPDPNDVETCLSISRYDDEGDCYNFLTGCHYHEKVGCDQENGLGPLFSDLIMPDGPTSFMGATGREEKYAYKHAPKASGVVLFNAEVHLIDGGRFLENAAYHYDPSDNTGKTLQGRIAFVYRYGFKLWGFMPIEFQELPESEYYTRLRREDQNHPDECAFYGTSEMNAELLTLSQAYYDFKDQHIQLSINDMSLRYGGVFDLQTDCMNPHWRHRTGKSVDINRIGANTILINRLIRENNIPLHQIEEDTIHYEHND